MKGKNIIIVDLDGTLSFIGDRVKYLVEKPVNWKAFHDACYDDKPHLDMIRLVRDMLFLDYQIIFCTGRDEVVREKTQAWLDKYGLGGNKLIMRPSGVEAPDSELKLEQMKVNGIDLKDIFFVLEDRNSVVQAWREAGVRVLQVELGDF